MMLFDRNQSGKSTDRSSDGSTSRGIAALEKDHGTANGSSRPRVNSSGFGAPNGGFGAHNGGFGAPKGGFGDTNGGFGVTNGGFGVTHSGFGVTNGGFSARKLRVGAPNGGFGFQNGGRLLNQSTVSSTISANAGFVSDSLKTWMQCPENSHCDRTMPSSVSSTTVSGNLDEKCDVSVSPGAINFHFNPNPPSARGRARVNVNAPMPSPGLKVVY